MFLRAAFYLLTVLNRSIRAYASSTIKYVPYKAKSTVATNGASKTASKSVYSSVKGSETAFTDEVTDDAEIEDTVSSSVSFNDTPIVAPSAGTNDGTIDWSLAFHGLGSQPFPLEVADILLAPIDADDIEIKPDGLLYLPEIKYRRILNRAFGPGGWGLAPRTESLITPKQISREYALICHGRLVSVARGEQDYFGGDEKVTTALEGCKSNALMRCCKDLGIASELWDPSFIRQWKQKYCDEVFAEHVVTKRKKKLWKLKKNPALDYPYKITK